MFNKIEPSRPRQRPRPNFWCQDQSCITDRTETKIGVNITIQLRTEITSKII